MIAAAKNWVASLVDRRGFCTQVLDRLLAWLGQGLEHPIMRSEACVKSKLAQLLAVLLAVSGP